MSQALPETCQRHCREHLSMYIVKFTIPEYQSILVPLYRLNCVCIPPDRSRRRKLTVHSYHVALALLRRCQNQCWGHSSFRVRERIGNFAIVVASLITTEAGSGGTPRQRCPVTRTLLNLLSPRTNGSSGSSPQAPNA